MITGQEQLLRRIVFADIVAANLVWGKSMREATEWASKYAAFKVTRKGSMARRPGLGYPELSEVEAFLSQL